MRRECGEWVRTEDKAVGVMREGVGSGKLWGTGCEEGGYGESVRREVVGLGVRREGVRREGWRT